jgi:pimeloyl-ACP methyl ester carboxylesterase
MALSSPRTSTPRRKLAPGRARARAQAAREAFAATEFARRIALAREDRAGEELGRPQLSRLLGELDVLAEPARRLMRRIEIAPARNPRLVMMLPGFGTHPIRMRYLAQQLERAGHCTKRWGLGFNWGPDPERFAFLEQRLLELHQRTGEQVVLLGWSLGGLYARELAKRQPDAVYKVISMGSPFSGSPRANNVWRVYQFITGHSVDAPPVEAQLAVKPPVETVALWSASDGVIAPRCAAGLPGERDRAIAVRCTHIGYTYSPDVVAALLTELDREDAR